jgi:hypothetical protein
MVKSKKKDFVTHQEVAETTEITLDLLARWFIEDKNGMESLYMPLTKIKGLMKIIENNYDRRGIIK